MSHFYEVFLRLCAQKGKAETTVCRELGLSPATAKIWRNGSIPRNSTVKMLAEYFGVDISIFDNEFPEPPIPTEPPAMIPCHVITADESALLMMMTKLNEKERTAVYNLVKELAK